MPARREVGIIGVQHQVFHLGLQLGVDCCFDSKAAGVEQLLRLGLRDALLGHDILHDLVEQCIGEVGGDGAGLFAAVLFGQHKGLRSTVAVVLLADHALLPHIVHNEVAAVDQILGVRVGVIVGGVFGNRGNGGALPQAQLADVLVEVLVGRRLYTLNGAGKADGVQVSLQNGLLGVTAAQAEGAVDLAYLAQCTIDTAGTVVIGQILDELLLQRGCALLGAVDGQQILVDHCADGTLEVDAGL